VKLGSDLKKLLSITTSFVTALSFCILPACAGNTAAPSQLQALQSTTPDFDKEIEVLLSLPEEKIDIGSAALTLEKEIYPELNVDVYSALLDHAVGRARTMTNGSTSPDQRIRVLNTLLYKIIGINYAFSDPNGDRNLRVRHLKGVLDTKRGNCVSMTRLYLAIAQRLGYPVYAVHVPDHIFVRYVDPNLEEQNIEASSNGGYISDEKYIKDLQISERGIKSGAYLKTLSNKEYLALLIAENAIYWGKHGDINRAIKYLEYSVKLYPHSPEINDNLGIAYLDYSKKFKGEEAKRYAAKSQFYQKQAIELGLAALPRKDYIKQMNFDVIR